MFRFHADINRYNSNSNVLYILYEAMDPDPNFRHNSNDFIKSLLVDSVGLLYNANSPKV